MKKLILIAVLSANVFAYDACTTARIEAGKVMKGFEYSQKDGDIAGMRSSYRTYNFWLKEAVINCPPNVADMARMLKTGLDVLLKKDGLYEQVAK